jgi:hypothetical protein
MQAAAQIHGYTGIKGAYSNPCQVTCKLATAVCTALDQLVKGIMIGRGERDRVANLRTKTTLTRTTE